MLTNLLLNNESELPETADFNQEARTEVKRNRRAMLILKADEIQTHLPEPQRRAMVLAREKGGFQHSYHHPHCRAWFLF